VIGGYLRGLASRVAADQAAQGLAIANVVAIAIAVFHPPITTAMMALYALDIVAIGVVGLARIHVHVRRHPDMLAKPPGERRGRQIFLSGVILIVCFFFVFAFLGGIEKFAALEMQASGKRDYSIYSHLASFWPALLSLLAGHVLSFRRNFLGKREYLRIDEAGLIVGPFLRVWMMVAVMVAAALCFALTRLPEACVVVFVVFKVLFDLEAHFAARRAAAAPQEGDAA